MESRGLINSKNGDEVYISQNIYNLEHDLLEYNPTTVALVPLLAEALLKKYNKLKLLNGSARPEEVFGTNFNTLQIGGAMIPKQLLQEYHKLGYNVTRGYGLTEASTNITLSRPISDEPDFGTVGHAISCNEVKIIDGEICVKGENVMLGYYNNPQLTKEVIVDGWLKTGDSGYILEDGRIYITGRIKNVIILANGENIIPEEIEEKFLALDEIKECAVFSFDDKKIYMVVKTASDAVEKSHLIKSIDAVNKNLEYSKQIDFIEITEEEFPKTAIGKIRRNDLKLVYVRAKIMNKIKKIIETSLYYSENISITMDFKDELGLSSFDMFSFWCEITQKLKYKLSKEEFIKCRCISDVCDRIIDNNILV